VQLEAKTKATSGDNLVLSHHGLLSGIAENSMNEKTKE